MIIGLLVPKEGVEPSLLAEHEFESCASTYSATLALGAKIHKKGILLSFDGYYFAVNIWGNSMRVARKAIWMMTKGMMPR